MISTADLMPIEEWEAQMSRLGEAIKKMKEAGL